MQTRESLHGKYKGFLDELVGWGFSPGRIYFFYILILLVRRYPFTAKTDKQFIFIQILMVQNHHVMK